MEKSGLEGHPRMHRICHTPFALQCGSFHTVIFVLPARRN